MADESRNTGTSASPVRWPQPMPSFNDITIYPHTPYTIGDPQYYEDSALINFVSDLYVRHMNGYKPPNTTRVSIQAAPQKMWSQTLKNGSLRLISAVFNYDEYSSLEIIHRCMLELSDEYGWDKNIFKIAYERVISANFIFEINYPAKTSRNKSTSAILTLKKTERLAKILVDFSGLNGTYQVVLIEKKNWWWYDSTYKMVKHYSWFDNERFGINLKKADLKIWYDTFKGGIFYQHGEQVMTEFDIGNVLHF